MEKILKIANIRRKKFKFYITKVKDRKGHDYRYSVSFEKSAAELNWKPNINFQEGIFETIEWYKNNSNWWKSLIN